MGDDVVAEVRREGADLVVVDAMLLGVLDAAARAGLRYAVLEHLFDAYLRGGWLHGPIGLWARARRLHPVRRWDGAALTLAATAEELDPAARSPRPANFRYTGPVLDVPRRPASFADRSVLVSLSTFSYPKMREVLQTIVDATAGLDARVVVTTGPVLDPADIRGHDRAEIHRFVDHDELMPGMSLVVGHGGHATAMRALAHDLPLLLLPLHPMLDQPLVARAVASAGAGQRLRRSASADQIRTAIAALLEDGPHRVAAAGLGERIRAARGTETAVAALEALLGGPAGTPGADRVAEEPAGP
jgi:UDP:flavonoid glycosyltransferase YjiC (YdhE family)